MLNDLIEIDNDIFKESEIDIGLYSQTRDVLNIGELNVVQKMLINDIITIKSYFLTKYNPFEEYLTYININKFKEYPRETFATINQKICSYNYFANKYKIEFNRKGVLFYIPNLNLYVAHDNQSITEFIKLCMIKNCKLAVISSYKDDSIINIPDKIAVRFIEVKNVFHYIYNDKTQFAIKSSKKRNQVPLIELSKNLQKRYDLVRSYDLYRKQLLKELVCYEEKRKLDKALPKFIYTEKDIDNICEKFILDIKNKEA